MRIERTDKTIRGAVLSILLTFAVCLLIGSLVAAAVGTPNTYAAMIPVVLTALAGGLIDIEVSY